MKQYRFYVLSGFLFLSALLMLTDVASGQNAPASAAISQLFNAEGSPVNKLWFLVNKVSFTFRSERDAEKRLDVNEEEESVIFYDEAGVRKPIKIVLRLSLENGPPVQATMSKEHEIRRIRVWCDLIEGDQKVGEFEAEAEDLIVTKATVVVAAMNPFVFRGVTFTPSLRYLPLQDMAGPAYFVRMEGVWLDLAYAK
jgi:hypothetical protein